MVDLNPNFTFMNKAADSVGYIYSAKYLYPSFHTSDPLYLLINHFFLKLPFGTEAWRMGLFSVIVTMIACFFIYKIIRKQLADKNGNRWYAIFGVIMYGFSALVFSQTVIVQTYPFTTMLAVGAYWFAINKKWKTMGAFLGAGLAVHLLMAFIALIMFSSFREYRRNWKALLITASFGLFYLYIPLTNRPPYMWFPDPNVQNTVWATITDTFATIAFLFGKLSIWDLPKRVLDALCVLGVSLGVLSFIPIVYYFKKSRIFKNVLFWLIIVPILIFIGELDMNTFDYMMPSMPFLVITACIGFSMLVERYGKHAKNFAIASLVVVLGFGAFNVNYFDIGRTLDPKLSATNLYYNEFTKIPDNSIVLLNGGAWEWEAVFLYNMDNDKHLIPICIDVLPAGGYRDELERQGVKMIAGTHENIGVASRETARSIVELNDDVWITVITDPYTFESVAVPANNDVSLVTMPDMQKIHDVAEHPTIKWKPYPPYDVLDSSLFITDWNYVLSSNYNVSWFFELAVIGLVLNWFLFERKKKKGVASNELEESAGRYNEKNKEGDNADSTTTKT